MRSHGGLYSLCWARHPQLSSLLPCTPSGLHALALPTAVGCSGANVLRRHSLRALQASDIEKVQLADSAAALSEKAASLEDQLRVSRENLASLRALADQGREDLRSQLQVRGDLVIHQMDCGTGQLKPWQVGEEPLLRKQAWHRSMQAARHLY